MTDRAFPMAFIVFASGASALLWVLAMLDRLPIR
jgi:hypothetical protein